MMIDVTTVVTTAVTTAVRTAVMIAVVVTASMTAVMTAVRTETTVMIVVNVAAIMSDAIVPRTRKTVSAALLPESVLSACRISLLHF
jgi:hypothetical protein